VGDLTISTLGRDRLPEARHVLARSFDHDPFFWELFPAPFRRYLSLRRFMGVATLDALPFGEAYAAVEDGHLVGGAVWLPPGSYPPGALRQLRQISAVFAISVLFPSRLSVGLRFLSAMQKAHPKDEHWYLEILGVDPARQRQGIGGQLLAPVLERVDREGLPCYLETQKEENLAFYRRHGFEVRDTVRPVPSLPQLWTMWREPR
jgi:GNAT superfamily N-acetyltransferase